MTSLALPVAIGRDYNLDTEDIHGSHDSRYPGLAIEDHGIAAMVNACADHDTQSERALAVHSILYPPLACKVTPESYGGVVVRIDCN